MNSNELMKKLKSAGATVKEARSAFIELGKAMSKNKLYEHQLIAARRGFLKKDFGYFMEQGTGKTLTVLEEAKYMPVEKILIVAPKCALITWCDEVAKWRPDLTSVYFKKGKRIKKKIGQADVFSINFDSINSRAGAEALFHFISGKKFLLVVDEAHFCKTFSSSRTQSVRFLKNLPNCMHTRLLTGTPTTNGSIDALSILNLLGSKTIGSMGESAYKKQFCEMRLMEFRVKGGKTRKAWQICGSKNLHLIAAELKRYSYRVLKEDCLDLPEKIYQKIILELPVSTKRMYENLKEDFVAELDSEGMEVSAEASSTKFLRLRQMCSGYVENDAEEIIEFKENPKIEALIELLANGEQAIVFCAFTREIEMVAERFKKLKISFGLYQGATSTTNRQKVKNDFINGNIQVFLAQEDAASTNLTLVQAKSIIYYSNSLRLDSRLQSEDRAHRIGLKHNLNIVDLCMKSTVEEHILKLLLQKEEVAATIASDFRKLLKT